MMKSKTNKKGYQQPKVEQVKLDIEISLAMSSTPPPNPQMPQAPGGFIQKIFKFGA
jgi:hypothetical protein